MMMLLNMSSLWLLRIDSEYCGYGVCSEIKKMMLVKKLVKMAATNTKDDMRLII